MTTDNQRTAAEEVAAVVVPAANQHLTLVHDKTSEEKAREDRARAMAEKTKVAKNRKRLTYMSVRKKAAKAVPGLAKRRAEAEIALKQTAEAQVKDIIAKGPTPAGVDQILAGYKALGYVMNAAFTPEGVVIRDGALKNQIAFGIVKARTDIIGDEDSNPYAYNTKTRNYSTEIIYIEPTDTVITAWEELESAKEAARINNEILQKAEDNLCDLEELGEVAEAKCLEAGMSDEELKQVGELEAAFARFLDDDLEDGSTLLQLAEKNS